VISLQICNTQPFYVYYAEGEAMGIAKSIQFKPINDHLTTSGAVTKEDIKQLKTEGYGAVINLLPDQHDKALPNEKCIIESQGISYIHIPVEFSAPQVDEYESFAVYLAAHRHEKVHVHCAANWRVSAFYAIYAVEQGIWTHEQARQFIDCIWDPGSFPAWKEFLGTRGL